MIVTGGCSAEVSQEKAMYDTHRGFNEFCTLNKKKEKNQKKVEIIHYCSKVWGQ